MTTTAEAATLAKLADKVWTCLGCGDELPPARGGYCDACVEWEETKHQRLYPGPNFPALDTPGETPGVDQTDPSAPPDPDPAPGRCPTCNDSGATCFDCGALELSALGRKLRCEMRDDRCALLARLRKTRRNQWPLLARAYALEIGGTPWVDVQPTIPGILWLWTTLERESA